MNVLVIGAAGFVGRYLIEYLQANYDCRVFATKLPHEDINAKCQVLDLDILDSTQIKNVLETTRAEWIFHLAAQSSAALAWKNPQLTVDINVKGTINILEAVRILPYKPRILVIGSGEEYGKIDLRDIPIKEDCSLKPGNIYAATKAAQSMLAGIYQNAYGMDLILVRSFNQTGAGQLPQFVVSDFCKQIAEIELGTREAIINTGNIELKRDFTDVRDAVYAYCLLMEKGIAGEQYNLGSGIAISLRDMLNMIFRLTDKKIAIRVDASKVRPSDVPIIVADITKIMALGYKPQYELIDTFKAVLEFWRQTMRWGD